MSRPATARLLAPCTPMPTTMTRIYSSELGAVLEQVELLQDRIGRYRNVAIEFAFDRRRRRAQNGSDDSVLRCLEREGRIGQQRIAGAHGVADDVGEAVQYEELLAFARRRLDIATKGHDAAGAHLENEIPATRLAIES